MKFDKKFYQLISISRKYINQNFSQYNVLTNARCTLEDKVHDFNRLIK